MSYTVRPDGRPEETPLTRTQLRSCVMAGIPLSGEYAQPGTAFRTAGEYDVLTPGPRLAQLAADAAGSSQRCAGLDDEELVGVLCAWQRLAAWAQAGTAAAVTELAARRTAQARERGDTAKELDTYVRDEIAAALTLTGLSAIRLLDTSAAIVSRLPDVHVALAQGRIDWPRARVLADELSYLDDDDLARQIAGSRLPDTGINTTGQLRARLQRDVLDADPAAAEARRMRARRETRLEAWHEDSGNAALAGRELPAATTIALFKQITETARWLQGEGLQGTMNQLRSEVYLALLSGRDPATLLPAISGTGDGTSADTEPATPDPNTGGSPLLTGIINLTMPLTAWALLSEASGEVAGYGPADAGACRGLASWADRLTRWCVTLTDARGAPVAHACAQCNGPPPGKAALRWATGLRDKLEYLESGTCSHPRVAGSYRPTGNLAHLVKIRQRTCSFPGCRRAARFCDLDHTLAFDKGGITCECNLAPLCRRHHRAKQTFGWQLEQTRPGHMTWRLPHNRSYATAGEPYPA